jgi:hypothetical protein
MKLKNIMGLFLVATVLGGCSSLDYDRLAMEELKNVRNAPRNIIETKTRLELPLMKFGRDFAYTLAPAYINFGVYPITNETSNKAFPLKIKGIILSAAAKLISSPIAENKMGLIDLDLDFQKDMYLYMLNNSSANPVFPMIFAGIEGSITEYEYMIETYEDNSLDATVGGGSTRTDLGAAYNKSSGVRMITLDLNIKFKSPNEYNKLFALGYTSNSLIVQRKTKGKSFYLYVFGNGFSIGRDIFVSQSPSYALRFLVEFSLIQLLGRANTVPYWHCVKSKNTDKLMMNYIAEDWEMKDKDEKLYYYSKLMRLFYGYYIAPLLTPAERERITFDTRNTEEGKANTLILLNLLSEYYGLTGDIYDLRNYTFIFNKTPMCGFPKDDKLAKFLKEKVGHKTFIYQTSVPINESELAIRKAILDW